MATVATPPALEREAHLKFLSKCLRMLPNAYDSLDVNRTMAAFFCLGGIELLGGLPDVEDPAGIIEWIYGLQITSSGDEPCVGGFRGGSFIGARRFEPSNIPFDSSHITATYNALTLLLMLGDDYSRVDVASIIKGLRALAKPDGSFGPVAFDAESDMRFVYCACVISYLINDWSAIDKELTVKFIHSSFAYDGGCGQGVGLESHGGSTYCALASLSLLGRLDAVPDRERTIKWLVMRQECGMQGRTNKRPDSCYSFWIGASLAILDAASLVDADQNRLFVCSCQQRGGGIAKFADTYQDIVHTYLGLAGLAIIGSADGLPAIHPAVNITLRTLERLKGTKCWRGESA